jgi:hypothetical protein
MKAIPNEALSFAEKHSMALLLGGAVVVGGYYYMKTHSSGAANVNADTSAAPAPVYAMPTVSSLGGGSAGLVATTSNPDAPISSTPSSGGSALDNASPFDWASLAFEQSKEADDFSIANRTLDAQVTMAELNAAIAMAGIQSANFSASAQLAQSFIMSGSMFLTGDVAGQTFTLLQAPKPYSGKNMTQVNAQQNSMFQSLLSQFGSIANAQPTPSLSNSTVSGNVSVASPVQSIGSAPASSSTNTSSTGSTITAVNDNATSSTFKSASTLQGGVLQ